MPEAMTTSTTDFRADQLQALLPSIWGLLNSLPGDEQIEMLEAFLAYYNRLGAQSSSKHIALGFIARMYLVCVGSGVLCVYDSNLLTPVNIRFNLSHNTMAISIFAKTQ
jgi:hypothetical protein